MTILQPKKVMQKVGLDITCRHSSDYGRRPNTIFPLSFGRLTAEVTDVPFLETKQGKKVNLTFFVHHSLTPSDGFKRPQNIRIQQPYSNTMTTIATIEISQ